MVSMLYSGFLVFVILLEISVASPALLDYADRANVVESKSTAGVLVNHFARILAERGRPPIFGHQDGLQVTNRQAVVQEDQMNINCIQNSGGTITYDPPLRAPPPGSLQQGQASGVRVTINNAVFNANCGRRTYRNVFPPGWGQFTSPTRGHLYGSELGGSGLDWRNIVAMSQATNQAMATVVEQRVARWFRDGRIAANSYVGYNVQAVYADGAGADDPPSQIVMNVQTHEGPNVVIDRLRVTITNANVPQTTVELESDPPLPTAPTSANVPRTTAQLESDPLLSTPASATFTL